MATISVIDDGPGVPVAAREQVFERFGRVATARDRGSGGTGLGLAIVRSIAERHGGAAWVDDAPDGPGACFIVELASGAS